MMRSKWRALKAHWHVFLRRLSRGRMVERLVLAVTVAVILEMTIGTAVFAWRARQDALDDWRQYMEHFSSMTAAHALETIKGADQVLRRVLEGIDALHIEGEQEFRRAMASRAAYEMLLDKSDDVPQIDVITIVADNGDVLSSSHGFPVQPVNLSDRDHFQTQKADPAPDLLISTPVRDPGTGRWTFHLARKIRGKSGRRLGVALVGIESGFFGRFYEGLAFSARDSVTLLRADGIVLARFPGGDGALGTRPAGGIAVSMLRSGADHATVLTSAPRSWRPAQRDLRLISTRAVRQYPLAVTTTVSGDVMLQRWRDTAWFIGTRMVVVDVLVGVSGFWLYRLLRRRRLTMEQLRSAKAAADAASRAKSDFLANMSHEMRTPLNGVIGYAELLAADLKGTPHEAFTEAIVESGRNLLAIVNALLDIRRIEAGALQLDVAPHSLGALLEDIAREHMPLAHSKGLRLEAVNEGAPPCIVCDRPRLRQALGNLVHNAVKFTQRGKVRLSAHPHPEGVEFRVADTGPGIDPAQHAAIFERFVQVDASRGRSHDGAGLGLALVRDVARLMGGRVVLESQPGAGSVFSLVLPLGAAT